MPASSNSGGKQKFLAEPAVELLGSGMVPQALVPQDVGPSVGASVELAI